MRTFASSPSWSRSPLRAELLDLYAQVDALLEGWACTCNGAAQGMRPRCCQFRLTGREPYPTAVELAEVRYGLLTAGLGARTRRHLPIAGAGPGDCPLLSADGRCRIYRYRPFGCRTFFCDDASPGENAQGARARLPRTAIQAIAHRIADLSARFDPRDPHPRPLVRALKVD